MISISLIRALGALLVVSLAPAHPLTSARVSPQSVPRRVPVLVLTGEAPHDWRWSSTRTHQVLTESGKFAVEVSVWPLAALENEVELSRYEAIVLDYDGQRWSELAEKNLLAAVERGTGLVALHGASLAFANWGAYGELLGVRKGATTSLSQFAQFDVTVSEERHPITDGLDPIRAHADRLLQDLELVKGSGMRTLASATTPSGDAVPVLLTGRREAGRVAHLLLGHVGYDRENWASQMDTAYQALLLRSVEWAATGVVTPMRRVAPNTLSDADRAGGWRLLFDGRTTAGWKGFRAGEGFPEESWRVEDGCLKVVDGDGDRNGLVPTESYEEFELELDWRVSRDVKSGFFFRPSADGAGYDWVIGPSATEPDAELSEERAQGYIEAEGAVLRPAGEFNHARVVATRYRVDHWINGIHLLTLDFGSTEWAELVRGRNLGSDESLDALPLGRLILEDQGLDVWFRNIKIRRPPGMLPMLEAAPSEPLDLASERDLARWTRHWWIDGNDSTWRFDPEGHLICSGLPQGYLRSPGAYTNFLLELEWRFHPISRLTGNGGVLIGITSDDTFFPVSVEVDLQNRKAGDLVRHHEYPFDPDPARTAWRITRQTHDAERNPGEWNQLALQLRQGVLSVFVNGELVNEAREIATVPGHVALVSDGVQMHYRNVSITPIR